jgi:urease accessory protein
MLRITEIVRTGQWLLAEQRDSITLDYDERHRRRRRYTAAGGTEFLLDLPEATVLGQGDGLRLEGGGYIVVLAAPEPLIEVTAASPAALVRLAWHLGNRHLPAEIAADRILIRHDHVIEAMLRGLGADVRPVDAPFTPEGGAYGEHNRDHRHAHGAPTQDHDRGHDHSHRHDHAHGHHHHHGHDHDHGHDHGHGH